MSKLVRSAKYKSEPIICWNSSTSTTDLSGSVAKLGKNNSTMGVRAGFEFSSPNRLASLLCKVVE